MAAAQAAGKFKDEIISVKTTMKVVDKATKAESLVDNVVDRDECNRPETTLEGLAKLAPVMGPDKFVTAGNASQLSDGAAALVLMEAKEAERRGLQPLGAFKGWAVAGCQPDGFCHPAPARAQWPEDQRHRPVGAERGFCQPVPVQP